MKLNPHELGSLISRVHGWPNSFTVTCQEVEGLVDTIEANQAEIARLQEKLELCREALQSIVDECVYYQTSVGEPTFYKVSRALEAIEKE